MKFTVVTGLSGAGKTQVLKYLEDCGYFCADNLLPAIIPQIFDIFSSQSEKFPKVALVTDMRVGDMIDELVHTLEEIRKKGHEYTLLFVTASDEALIKRYKETRHSHPIISDEGLVGSIRLERKRLESLYQEADYVIDTTDLELFQLQHKLRKIYSEEETDGKIKVNVIGFGFKYGLPLDADIVFDVRCFANPFYVPELKHKTGVDKAVSDYVFGFDDVKKFYKRAEEMITELLPLYYEEGKDTLTIAVGCTGGKHRSVSIALKLSDDISKNGYKVNTILRDIDKGR